MDPADAHVLITTRFPSLDLTDVRLLGAGWDYDAFLVRDGRARAWVFRFPKRGDVMPKMHREIAWLPHVARALAGVTRVPEFEFVAQESKWYPRRLHAIPLDSVADADFPDEVGTPRTWFDSMFAARERIADALPDPLAGQCRHWLETVDLPQDDVGKPCLVHGDLGSVHVLVNDELELTALLDFGDIDAGDPATDVAYVTCWLGREGTKSLLTAYGASEAFAARVRVVGLLLAMSWVLECLEITREPPQDFHLQWLETALTVAA